MEVIRLCKQFIICILKGISTLTFSSRLAPTLWKSMTTIEEVNAVVKAWMLTLEKNVWIKGQNRRQ